MELISITKVSKEYDVSTRTLRYYEQIGLIQSDIRKNHAYRIYNEPQLEKLRQVLILRKLRIPLKQIVKIFENAEISKTLEILTKNMQEIQDEINYLLNIKDTLSLLIEKLKSNNIDFLDTGDVLNIVNTLPPSKKLNEYKKTNGIANTNTAFPSFCRLKDSEVRIITLPPATIASYKFEGDAPEDRAAAVIDDFVRRNDLIKIKPDLRRYGFRITYLTNAKPQGYEMWVTIPDNFKVSAPIKKKKFAGGLYAAHTIPFDGFEEGHLLCDWVINSDKYMPDCKGGNEIMKGNLEELLNYVHYVTMPDGNADEDMQIDLLMPIKVMESNEYSRLNLENSKNKTPSQLETEACQGDAKAQWDYACCYFKGCKGIPVDYQKAAEWYQKAANQGCAKAQCALGYCYMNGLGLPKNEEKAAELYEKAAVQDYAAAMINLAWCYTGGIGISQDYQKGKYWFEKAAAQNENQRIKCRAESVLSELCQLIDREDIALIFHRSEALQAVDEKNELHDVKNKIIVKIFITYLCY